MMIKCAIVDDEPLALDLLESYVKKTPILELCGKYANGVEALSGLQQIPVDLLFLDIQMPELSGLELSKMLNTSHTCIVFTTAFSQYAIEGYKVNAIDYLLKPISYVDFVGAVSRTQKWIEKNNTPSTQKEDNYEKKETLASTDNDDYMFVKSDYKILRINFDDILYIEGLKDYVKIYLTTQIKPILSLTSMRSIENILPSNKFFRIHRSYIVNMRRVAIFERGQIVFGEKHLPVSDSYKSRVQDYITSHLLQGR